jgi:hypothetical protein
LPGGLILDRQKPAFAAGRDDLVLAEREGGCIAEAADALAADFGTMRLCTVFDNFDVAAPDDVHDAWNVSRPAGEVHRNDRPRPLAEHSCDGFGGDVTALIVDVGEYGCRADQAGAGRRGDEGARRYDHLVARADAKRPQRQLQRNRAVCQGYRTAAAEARRACLFEGEDVRPGPLIDAPGAENCRDGLDFVMSVERPTLVGSERKLVGIFGSG